MNLRKVSQCFTFSLLLFALLLVACQAAPVPTTIPPTVAVPTAAPQPTTAPPVAPTAAGGSGGTTTLTVLAAASLTDAFKTIGTAFQKANPGVAVTFSFAGSQALRTQIEQGAKADVFASADTKNMDPAQRGKLARHRSADFYT